MKQSTIVVFLLGVIVGLLSWNTLTILGPESAWAADAAGGTSGSTNGYIAVTGAVTNNFAGLWVLNLNETKHSPSLCLYIPNNSGRRIQLSAARRIKYDFQLLSLNDESGRRNKSLRPSVLGRKIKELNKKEEGRK